MTTSSVVPELSRLTSRRYRRTRGVYNEKVDITVDGVRRRAEDSVLLTPDDRACRTRWLGPLTGPAARRAGRLHGPAPLDEPAAR